MVFPHRPTSPASQSQPPSAPAQVPGPPRKWHRRRSPAWRAAKWCIDSVLRTAAAFVFVGALLVGYGAARAQLDVLPAGSGGGGLTASAADALYCRLAGCTFTGAATYSGVTNDVTTGVNEDLRLRPNGTGALKLQSGSTIGIENTSGTEVMTVSSSISGSPGIFNTAFSAHIRLGGNVMAGSTLNLNATTSAFCGADSSTVLLWCIWGSGKVSVETRQAVTCADSGSGAPGALTLDATSSVVYLTNSDPDGCVVTVSETSAILGSDVRIVVVSNAGGVVTFPDVANVLAAPACADTTGLGTNDAFSMHYADAANDLYVGLACADN